ncbi:BEN domain-containing protein 7 isoform X2 [Hyla sarda]|uniref:BEN domain-containing protein 7 isoform X2 n=1 Tax=Hyla sarda TaxID=327740 RepID=UPI0024C22321|nr:BEN domain-containing protein 7 isoform X2 [Hyla sarda]
MEFTERRRSRKSQSYKLVNEDYHSEVFKSQDYSDINGESVDFHQFSGDEGMEIKKQITGMRRLLNDSTGWVYQRVGKEGEKLKEGVHDLDMNWTDSMSTSCSADNPIHSTHATWNNVPVQTSDFPGQYGTRSKTVQNQLKNPGTNGELRMVNSVSESKCCTCNCQPTLQAILQELKAMRKFMQVQAVAQTRQQTAQSCLCSQKTVLSRKRIMKKKVLPKNTTVTSIHSTSVREHKPLLLPDRSSSLSQADPVKKEDDHVPGFGIVVNSSSSDMCSWQKGLMSLCQNLSWTPYCLTIRGRAACSLENLCVLFSMIKLWQHHFPMEKGSVDSMTTGKDWIKILWEQ